MLRAEQCDQQPHHCSTGVLMHTHKTCLGQSLLCWGVASNAVQSSRDTRRNGYHRSQDVLPLPRAALTMLEPTFQLLLPLASGSQPVCLQRKSLSPTQDFLPHELIFFFSSLIPFPATAKIAERKSRSHRPAANLLLSFLQSYHQPEHFFPFQNVGSADL